MIQDASKDFPKTKINLIGCQIRSNLTLFISKVISSSVGFHGLLKIRTCNITKILAGGARELKETRLVS